MFPLGSEYLRVSMIGIEPSEAATRVHATGLIQDPQRIRVCDRAFRHDVRVGIESTDQFVELDEPLSVNSAIVEGLQAVLHAHVVERSAGQARGAVAPDKIGQIVVKAASYAVGPLHWGDRPVSLGITSWQLPGWISAGEYDLIQLSHVAQVANPETAFF